MYDRDPSTTRSYIKEILWSLLLLLITFGKTCLWRQHCFRQTHTYLSLQFLTPLPVPCHLMQTSWTELHWHVRHIHLPNQTNVYAQLLLFFSLNGHRSAIKTLFTATLSQKHCFKEEWATVCFYFSTAPPFSHPSLSVKIANLSEQK